MPPRRRPNEEAAGGPMSQQDLEAAAVHVVRLALFHEHRRVSLRRDVITKSVIPNAPRAFTAVLARAQTLLVETFGLELEELRAKGRGEDVAAQAAYIQAQTQAHTQSEARKRRLRGDAEDGDEEDDDEAGTQYRRPKKVPGTGTYVLRSVLPAALVAEMNRPAVLPYFEEDGGGANVEVDSEGDAGALVRWDKADPTPAGHVALLGIRTVILCLILAHGRVIEERALYAFLRRLNLERHTVLPWKSPDSYGPSMTLEQFMDVLARQHYLEKTKLRHAGGDGPTEEIEWRWGSREAEFSENAAAAFIEQLFLGDSDESDSEDEEPGPSRRRTRNEPRDDRTPAERRAARRKAKRQRIRTDLERAAGGPLTGHL